MPTKKITIQSNMGAKSYNTEMRNGAKTNCWNTTRRQPSFLQAQSQTNLLTIFNGKTPAQMHHQQSSEKTPRKLHNIKYLKVKIVVI
jgi:hypothetical protein